MINWILKNNKWNRYQLAIMTIDIIMWVKEQGQIRFWGEPIIMYPWTYGRVAKPKVNMCMKHRNERERKQQGGVF